MDNELHALQGRPILVGIDPAHGRDLTGIALINASGLLRILVVEDTRELEQGVYRMTITGRNITDNMLYPKLQNFTSRVRRKRGGGDYDHLGRRR